MSYDAKALPKGALLLCIDNKHGKLSLTVGKVYALDGIVPGNTIAYLWVHGDKGTQGQYRPERFCPLESLQFGQDGIGDGGMGRADFFALERGDEIVVHDARESSTLKVGQTYRVERTHVSPSGGQYYAWIQIQDGPDGSQDYHAGRFLYPSAAAAAGPSLVDLILSIQET